MSLLLPACQVVPVFSVSRKILSNSKLPSSPDLSLIDLVMHLATPNFHMFDNFPLSISQCSSHFHKILAFKHSREEENTSDDFI